MKTLFILLPFFFVSFNTIAAPAVPDAAVEGFPGSMSILDGRYVYFATSSTGHMSFRTTRGDNVFVGPQTMGWSPVRSRWEIYATKLVSGVPTSTLVATSTFTGTYPPFKGWTVYYPYGNPLGLVTTLKVYQTVTQTSVCDCFWSNPATWSSGFVPERMTTL